MAEARIARSFRLMPDTSAKLDGVAAARFGGQYTKALEAAIDLAALVYGSPAGRAGADPADALERYTASRRAGRSAK